MSTHLNFSGIFCHFLKYCLTSCKPFFIYLSKEKPEISGHREFTMGCLQGGRWSPEGWIYVVLHKACHVQNNINLSRGWPSSFLWTCHGGFYVSHNIKQYNIQQISQFVQPPRHGGQKNDSCTSLQRICVRWVTSRSKESAASLSFKICDTAMADSSILEQYLHVKHN